MRRPHRAQVWACLIAGDVVYGICWVGDICVEVHCDGGPISSQPHRSCSGVWLHIPEAVILTPLAKLLVCLVGPATHVKSLTNLSPEFPLFCCGCLDGCPCLLPTGNYGILGGVLVGCSWGFLGLICRCGRVLNGELFPQEINHLCTSRPHAGSIVNIRIERGGCVREAHFERLKEL